MPLLSPGILLFSFVARESQPRKRKFMRGRSVGRQALTTPTFSSTMDQIMPLSSDQVGSVRETLRTLGARIMLTMQTLRVK